MKCAYFLRERALLPVPETITFGSHCVEVPELEKAGIPAALAMLSIVENKVEIGDWVQRGQLLVEASLPVFDRREPPSRTLFWAKDSFTYLKYQLYSPVSGLVLDMRKQLSAYHDQYADSGKSLCYGENEVRPVLLIPDDEPPPGEWSYSYYRPLYRSLRANYWQLLYSHGTGYMRLPEALADMEEARRAMISAFIENAKEGEQLKRQDVEVLPLEELKSADRFAIDMRSHDLILRRKLRHIGGMAYT
jgi:hypothetical protein